jgi:heme exporter protein B
VVWNALFWIILLFASVNTISKGFTQESKGRLLYYYSITSASNIILAKIIYNTCLMLLIAGICFLFYSVVFQNPVQDVALYALTVFLGALSFSSLLSMVSAIASKVNNNSTLMAVLSFPIMVPLIMLLIKCSKNAMDGLDRASSYNELIAILMLNVITVVLSLLLFPYIWRD